MAKLPPIRAPRFNEHRPTRYGELLYNKYDAYVGQSIALYGEFSELEAQLFRDLVRPGDVVLDVGANIGAHTVGLAQLVGREGQVIAYEPQRQLYYVLCGNIALNSLDNVTALNVALGSARGETSMPRWTYAAPNNFGGLALGDWPDGIGVPVVTLDEQAFDKVHFVKLDVEGMELDALQGAKETIARQKPVLYVENDRPDKSNALVEFIANELNYSMFWHRPPLYNPENWDRNPHNVFGDTVSVNMLCVSPDNPGTAHHWAMDQKLEPVEPFMLA